MTTTTIESSDIECEGCATSIKSALGRLAGINDVQVSVADQRITVEFDDKVALGQIKQAVSNAGFAIKGE